jgi:hypothetical protein
MHPPRRPPVHLAHSGSHCPQLFHLPKPRKEAKALTLLKAGQGPKIRSKFKSDYPLAHNRQAIRESNSEDSPKAHQCKPICFPCSSQHDSSCLRLSDHVTFSFNKNMSTAAVLLDIVKSFNSTWHLFFVGKLYKLKFSISLLKFIISFLSQRKFRVSAEGEISTPIDIQEQGSVLSPTLYSRYVFIYK